MPDPLGVEAAQRQELIHVRHSVLLRGALLVEPERTERIEGIGIDGAWCSAPAGVLCSRIDGTSESIARAGPLK